MRIITNTNYRPEEVNMLMDKDWQSQGLPLKNWKEYGSKVLPYRLWFDFFCGREICFNAGNGLRKYKLIKYFPF